MVRQAFVVAGGVAPSSKRGTMICSATVVTPAELLVVGCGRLGRRVAKLWNHGEVIGETRTETNHEEIRALGITPRSKAERRSEPYSYVAVTAPPTGNDDYAKEVSQACSAWDGKGVLIFTSSVGVYDSEIEGTVTEQSPVQQNNIRPRTQALIDAESHVLQSGGCVIRLSGLYDRTIGPHNYWLQQQEVKGDPNGLINMIHWDDCATAVIKALEAGREKTAGKVYLVSDGHPVTRLQIIEAALQDPIYSSTGMPKFAGAAGPDKKKIVDCSATMAELDWKPQYASMQEYFAAQK